MCDSSVNTELHHSAVPHKVDASRILMSHHNVIILAKETETDQCWRWRHRD